MAPTNRRTVGSILVVTLTLLVGASLVAGPVLAQETTDDGMMDDGTETMDDDSMGNESETEDGSMTDDEMVTETMDDGMTDDGSMTEDDSMDDGSMGTETMDDGSMTDEEMGEGDGEDGMDDETASGGQPGFGVVAGLVALVAAAAFVLYRRGG